MPRPIKPTPPNQSDIIQDQINPYLKDMDKPVSRTVFSKDRGTEHSMRGDKVKDISVGLEDIDTAILYYFNNIIRPTIIQDNNQMVVKTIFASPERWQSMQQDGFYRDGNNHVIIPLIVVKRESIEKNRSLGNKIDGNRVHLHQIMGTKYNIRNAYDKFDILNNRLPSEQFYISVVPDYVTLTYNCSIFTNFLEQSNKIVEAVQFASDSYWGDLNRWRFRSSIDSFTISTVVENGTDRVAKSTFTLKVQGYIIPNTVNKKLANSTKYYSKSQIVFDNEVIDSSGQVTNVDTLKFANKPQATNGMGATSFVGGGNNISNSVTNNITVISNVPPETITYININKELTGNAINSTTATFPSGWIAAPSGLPNTSKENFTFFCNGQLIEKTAVVSFTESGGISTLVIDPVLLSYELEIDDEIVAIGKFV
jgi:hypothetical protein